MNTQVGLAVVATTRNAKCWVRFGNGPGRLVGLLHIALCFVRRWLENVLRASTMDVGTRAGRVIMLRHVPFSIVHNCSHRTALDPMLGTSLCSAESFVVSRVGEKEAARAFISLQY